MTRNHFTSGAFASRTWRAVFGASFAGATLLAGCSAAPADEATAQAESALVCPVGQVQKCTVENHYRDCNCYPAPTPPPPPTCSIGGWGNTPQGREVQISFNTSLPVAMTVHQGGKTLHDGVGTSHTFYVAGLQGDANNYAAFAIDGCGATINWGYTLPSCGAEGQTACDGRCEKGLADHQIFGLGSCRVDGKNYDHPAPTACSTEIDRCPDYTKCGGGGLGCRPCGGHGQPSCYRLPTGVDPNPPEVAPCHPGVQLLSWGVGYLGTCTSDVPVN